MISNLKSLFHFMTSLHVFISQVILSVFYNLNIELKGFIISISTGWWVLSHECGGRWWYCYCCDPHNHCHHPQISQDHFRFLQDLQSNLFNLDLGDNTFCQILVIKHSGDRYINYISVTVSCGYLKFYFVVSNLPRYKNC